jgi:hypothetical protein
MKKILSTILLFGFILAISSCEYDDSNDIDIIVPNDTTAT